MVAACFLWSGFIRSGLGFGGLVMMIPFALKVVDFSLEIMPLAILYAFLVGVSTVILRFHNEHRLQIMRIIGVMIFMVVLGLIGLITIPEKWLLLLVFGVVLACSVNYFRPLNHLEGGCWSNIATIIMRLTFRPGANWLTYDRCRSGGARIEGHRLRDSLLALWVILSPPKLVILSFSGMELN